MKTTTTNWSPTSRTTISVPLAARLAVLALCGGLILSSSSAGAAGKRGPTVTAALQTLQSSGQITASEYQADSATYSSANRTLKKLKGTRRSELAGVLANVQAIAAAGQFIPSRLPALFLTLERNRQYWTTRPLLSYGQRVSFPGSLLVWQYYPGQGIEIQWLGTFGNANGYYLSGTNNANLRQLLGEIMPLATKRAGGLAWEYLFKFDGGNPPWVSGLAQGTALQAFSRAWSRFKEPAYLTTAQQALGIFQTPPPTGIRVKTSIGSHYLQYSFAPQELILNGFIQSVIGLYDFAQITKDPLGLQLFEAGDAQARADVPHYDTGAWSLYDQNEESALNYHELLTEFLQNLCKRTQQGPPFVSPGPAPPASTPTPSTGTGPATTPSGGTSATSERARIAASKTPPTPILADQIYCTTAQRFVADLHTPPVLTLISTKLRGGTRAGVRFVLSKVSNVSLSVSLNGKRVWTNSARITHGSKQILWVTPKKGGVYTVTLRATDLAGNSSSTTGNIALSAAANAGK